jgi:hypothetical protein
MKIAGQTVPHEAVLAGDVDAALAVGTGFLESWRPS